MSEVKNTGVDTGPRSLVLPIVLVALAAAVFAFAFINLGGMDLIDRFFDGDMDERAATPVPPKPTKDPDEDTTPSTEDPANADDPGSDADDVDPDAGDTPAPAAPAPAASPATKPVTTPAVAPAPGDVVAPSAGGTVPAEARERMYWEQVDSQDQIGRLISGKIRSFAFSPQSATATEARLRVSTTGDATVSGNAVLRAYDGNWFFSSITRDGQTPRGAAGRKGDSAVVDTIVKQQIASQPVIASFVDGGYRTINVNNVSMGAGTATISVEFTGGTQARRAGEIVAISKDINGVKHWFLTSFREL